ncbi:MAG: hypothetical protein AB7K09_03145 [Planctomycetota bacterium]
MLLAASDWIVWLTGFDPDKVPPGAEVNFELARFGRDSNTFLLLLAGAVAIALVVHAYVRTPEVSRRSRTVLAAFRILMLALIVIALFEPRLTIADTVIRPATTIVLIDRSLSMDIDDRVPDPHDTDVTAAESTRRTRYRDALEPLGFAEDRSGGRRFTVKRSELVNAVLARGQGELMRSLLEHNQVRVWQFDDRVNAVALETTDGPPPTATISLKNDTESSGGATDLALALRQAMAAVDGANEQLAAVVIFSDGRRTTGDAIGPLGEDLRRRGAPVYVFAPGSDRKPANLRVTAILGPERMFRGDPAVFDVTIRNDGCTGEAEVRLIEHLSGGRTREVDKRVVKLDPAQTDITVTPAFSYLQDETAPLGRRVLEAVIAPREEESTPDDNSRRLAVEILDRRARLLVIGGVPTFEFRFLKNLLIREKTIEVSCWLQTVPPGAPQQGNKPIEKLPATAEELYEFDAVLAMDPDWNALGDDFLKLLEGFVSDYGGGLGVVAGETYTTQYLAAGEASGSKGARALRDLMPFVPDLSRAVNDRSVHASSLTLAVTDEGREHPLGRLTHNIDRVASTWSQLPPIHWAWPIAEAKPGATVYLRHASLMRQVGDAGEVVMAAHQFGAGRVVGLSTDDTWRWRSVAESYHERFWVQLAHHLIESRALGGRRRVQLFTDHERVSLGELVMVRAQVFDAQFAPLKSDKVRAQVRLESGETLDLDLYAAMGRPGWFGAQFAARELGTCEITMMETGVTRPGEQPASVVVQVEPPQIEFDDPTRDLTALTALVKPTGGKLMELDEVGATLASIPSRERKIKSPGRPHLLWATPLLLVLAGVLLCAEWIWRKRVQLV